MRLRDLTIRELADMDPSELSLVHDVIRRVKAQRRRSDKKLPEDGAARVRRALSGCKGALSDDVSALREDRL
ncbi:MAG: hypothetical protein GF331_05040 [Chitinivibrionales bacterium]|nr:hypothetical protein [Chitinivibrionales bacterium]